MTRCTMSMSTSLSLWIIWFLSTTPKSHTDIIRWSFVRKFSSNSNSKPSNQSKTGSCKIFLLDVGIFQISEFWGFFFLETLRNHWEIQLTFPSFQNLKKMPKSSCPGGIFFKSEDFSSVWPSPTSPRGLGPPGPSGALRTFMCFLSECLFFSRSGLHLCVDAVPFTHPSNPCTPLTRSTTHPSSPPHTVTWP